MSKAKINHTIRQRQRVSQGAAINQAEIDMVKLMHNRGGTKRQTHDEQENEHVVVASSMSGRRVWPIPSEIFDGLLNKRFIFATKLCQSSETAMDCVKMVYEE